MRRLLALSFIAFLLIASIGAPGSDSQDKKKEAPLNVLLITIDTLRTDRLSCYTREHVDTPNIDSLAARGFLFTQAFAHNSTTLPSHANILLGTTPLYHGIHENGTFIVSDRFLTLAEHLKGHGYSTGAFVGAYPLDSRFGLDQGFDVYDDDYRAEHSPKLSFIERKAEKVVGGALGWLRTQESPWFLWVHCFDPHDPYEPPEPFRSQYKNRPYDGEVAYVDSVMGRLFSYMDKEQLFGQTLVILTGDHGESLGQHGEMTHGYFIYNTTVWVPLIISVPEGGSGLVSQAVAHTDVFPTVCDVLGIETPSFIQGISLVPAIKGRNLAKRSIYVEALTPYYNRGWAPMRGYMYEQEKFIESPIPELYDLGRDFDELNNLARTRKLDPYQKQLARITEELSLPEEESQEKRRKIDREALEKLRSLGYISSQQVSYKEKFNPRDDVKMILPYHNRAIEALELSNDGKIDEGVDLLKKVITERGDIDVGYLNLATLYKKQGRYKDALEVLKMGVEQLPLNYDLFSTYINDLLNAAQFDEVIRVIREKNLRQMEYDPEIWTYLGVAYSSKGDYEQAVQAYQMSVSIDREYHVALNNLGAVYLSIFLKTQDRGAFQDALQSFKKAIEVNPEYASAYNGLGGAYKIAGDLEAAVFCFEKALEIEPGLPRALYNLGVTYLDRGDKVKALDYLNKFKEARYRFLPPSERERLEELIKKCREK